MRGLIWRSMYSCNGILGPGASKHYRVNFRSRGDYVATIGGEDGGSCAATSKKKVVESREVCELEEDDRIN